MPKPVSDAVKDLKVEKSAFDAALKKLIATSPIRKAMIAKRRPWGGPIPPKPEVSR